LPSVSVDSKGKLVTTPASDEKAQLAGPLNFTATVAEVGTVPKEEQLLADFFKAEGSSLAKGVSSALETQWGLQPSTSNTGSGGKAANGKSSR
jgi:hypothetical protein